MRERRQYLWYMILQEALWEVDAAILQANKDKDLVEFALLEISDKLAEDYNKREMMEAN